MLLGAAIDPHNVYITIFVAIDLGANAPAMAVSETCVVHYHQVSDSAPTNTILPYVVYRRASVLYVLSGI